MKISNSCNVMLGKCQQRNKFKLFSSVSSSAVFTAPPDQRVRDKAKSHKKDNVAEVSGRIF